MGFVSRIFSRLKSYAPKDLFAQLIQTVKLVVSGQPRVPPSDLLTHVVGHDDVALFLTSGKSVYLQMCQALRKYVDRSFHDYHEILDFGVGCGRLERWFDNETLKRLTGVDVSNNAIKFCSKHLKGRYIQITLDAPLPVKNNHFDLVLSFSVFSHMVKEDAESWISELHRVTKPNAILLITTHMEWCAENLLSEEKQLEFADQGIAVIPYTASGNHHDRYVNTYFSKPIWRGLWEGKFELVGIGYGRDAQEFASSSKDYDPDDLLPMGQALSVFRRRP